MLLIGTWSKEKKVRKEEILETTKIMKCLGCKEVKPIDTGFAFCSACIEKARAIAVNKSVSKHVQNGFKHLFMGKLMFAKIDFSWALEKFLIR